MAVKEKMVFREQKIPPELNRSILVIGLNGEVRGLNRKSGEQIWSNKLRQGGFGIVRIAIRSGLLIVSSGSVMIYRLDYETGATIWEYRTQCSGTATLLVEHDCILVAKSGYLDCLTHDGEKLWTQSLKGMSLGSVGMGFPGNVAQADED